ncbi:MAG: phosphatidate cytidylyltransferase [Candidatus Hydrogenedentota bacterium]|nr:MAG: phosphatidate cytidylyltransferase [Candidatus Hydrogenedentota bacterium]
MSAESRSRKARYISATVGIPLGLGLCLFSPLLFNLVAVFLITVGVIEFYAMARHRGLSPHSIIGTSCSVAICLLACVARPITLLYSLAASTIAVCTFAMARGNRDAMANIAVTVFGVFYVGWLCSHVILLRRLPLEYSAASVDFGGAGYVIMLLVLLWLGDGGAFFAGTTWGRHKLVPAVSPNKTVEGSLGGIVMTLVGALLVKDAGRLLEALDVALFPGLSYSQYLLVGLGIAVAGQVGDLCESYLKRDAGLKDTGNLLPGHGGFLDRFDSLIFAAPLFYYFLELRSP